MNERNTGWCRTLGNYAPGPRPMRGAAPRVDFPASPQWTPSMAFKPPRPPNPNVALLQRQRAPATPHVRTSALGRVQARCDGERVAYPVRRAMRVDAGEIRDAAQAAD
jgi:hypothetical protein